MKKIAFFILITLNLTVIAQVFEIQNKKVIGFFEGKLPPLGT